jgi:hypothetical protein
MKIETQLSEHLWWNFFHQALELFFLGSHAKFQPKRMSGFLVMAILSGLKRGIFAVFWGEN